MAGDQTPGVYPQDVFPAPAPSWLTGVPLFLGLAVRGDVGVPHQLTLWPQFEAAFGPAGAGGFLGAAVRGFFENDGLLCYVVRLDGQALPPVALRDGLAATATLDDVDLVCVPDGQAADLQRQVLDHCQHRGERFAILDGPSGTEPKPVETQRTALAGASGDYGALYWPWLGIPGGDRGQTAFVPPCGHVAGVYSRSDQQTGPHRAPANAVLEGVLDLAVDLSDHDVGAKYALGINCIRAFRGRGVRVWGARTLSNDPAWQDVTARRLVITMRRWIGRFMSGLVHEPNDVRLWIRIMRELTAYLRQLYERGAFAGSTVDEAFYVKCDAETNPPAVVDAGMVVTQIGVALAAPAEFTVVRIVHGASGVIVSAT